MSGGIPAELAVAALIAVIVIAVSASWAWHEWIELQRLGLDRRTSGTPSGPAARIELADLKERVRKLEAIAAGVDL